MAWWNKPAANLTPAVTIDRVAAWFDGEDLSYERHESGEAILSGFGEYGFLVAIPDASILQVRGQYDTGLTHDEQTLSRLRETLNEFNTSQVFPTLSTLEDENVLHVVADIVASVAEGMNDEQLAAVLDASASIIVRTFEALGDALGIVPKVGEDQ